MVYLPEDGHPSQYKPGPTWVNFVHATNAANHYAMPPSMSAAQLFEIEVAFLETFENDAHFAQFLCDS